MRHVLEWTGDRAVRCEPVDLCNCFLSDGASSWMQLAWTARLHISAVALWASTHRHLSASLKSEAIFSGISSATVSLGLPNG